MIKQQGKIILALLLYVDDILYCGTTETVMKFEKSIQERFKVRTKAEAVEFIGIEQKKQQSNLILHQSLHISQAATKFGVTEHRSVATPLETTALENGPSEPLESAKLFQSLVGTLNFISVCTRPDIAIATSFLARSNKAPTMADLRRAKRTLAYLFQTRNKGLQYTRVELKDVEVVT